MHLGTMLSRCGVLQRFRKDADDIWSHVWSHDVLWA